MMSKLHTLLKLEESVKRNCFQIASECFSDCLQTCDAANLKEPLLMLTQEILYHIGEILTNPDAMLAHCSSDERELYMNNYCSVC